MWLATKGRDVPKEMTARQEALAAIDEFERTRCAGGLSKADSALLSRLRNNEYRDELDAAWQLIRKYRKTPEDDQLLITFIFNAWHFALEARPMVDQYNNSAKEFEQARRCPEFLRTFFVGGKI